jgi:hypothetical protein
MERAFGMTYRHYMNYLFPPAPIQRSALLRAIMMRKLQQWPKLGPVDPDEEGRSHAAAVLMLAVPLKAWIWTRPWTLHRAMLALRELVLTMGELGPAPIR